MLSFFSIFGIQNNGKRFCWQCNCVVNCFHFSVSLGYKTTCVVGLVLVGTLWIAFIFQYLWDTKQLGDAKPVNVGSCELLSFFSIFGIQNNTDSEITKKILVVNCFHFSVSLGYKTTNGGVGIYPSLLWIAFIFQYLWDTKQLA